MSKEYKLTTVVDIYKKVPADKIGECMGELAAFLIHTKELQEVLNTVADGSGDSLELPEEFTWVDDGKGELTLTINDDEGNELMTSRYIGDA